VARNWHILSVLADGASSFFLVKSVVEPRALLQVVGFTNNDPGRYSPRSPQCRYIRIGGELGEKLGAILKTPLMVRGHFGDANAK
jgi:hypothetical protein